MTRRTLPSWLSDFDWHWNGLTVRQTGAFVPFGDGLGGTLSWLRLYAALAPRRLSRPRFTIAGVPHSPRPWYLFWASVVAAGGRVIADPDVADLLVQFEDATHSAPVPSAVSGARRVINRDCLDVSKSRVAEVFAQVFGYHLDVDPQAHQGLVVVKSETNGAHDGRIVSCPTPREDGLVYQRLIDNRLDAERVEDIRCPTVHGTIPVVFLKRRSVATRFANYNSEVVMTQADAVFSPAERARISDFCRAMQLDWGGLDVLRDRSDGRLYIVDVNKTDMGPPTALALTDQIAAVERLGAAFTEKFLIAPERGARATPGHAARQQDVVS